MYEDHMYDELFAKRLAQLRINKGVSAREMSLNIGQNPAYINNIENRKALPSMNVFFYICEYLEVSPMEFFDIKNENPDQVERIVKYMNMLSRNQLEHIEALSHDLAVMNGNKDSGSRAGR